jgi:hypothetical protein
VWDELVEWEMCFWEKSEWLKNQAGEEKIGVMGGGNRLVGERFVSACGHEKARRVWDRAGWEK